MKKREATIIYVLSFILVLLLLKYGLVEGTHSGTGLVVLLSFIPIINTAVAGLFILLNVVVLFFMTFGAVLEWVR